MGIADLLNALNAGAQGGMQGYQQGQQLRRQQLADQQAQQMHDAQLQEHQANLLNHLITLRQAGVPSSALGAIAQSYGATVPTIDQPNMVQTQAAITKPAGTMATAGVETTGGSYSPIQWQGGHAQPMMGTLTKQDGTKQVSLLDLVSPKSEMTYHTGKPGEVVWSTDSNGSVKVAGTLPGGAGQGGKRPIRAVDLGDRVVTYYSDGTTETQTKGAAPRVFAPPRPTGGGQPRLVRSWDPQKGAYVMVPATDGSVVRTEPKTTSGARPASDREITNQAMLNVKGHFGAEPDKTLDPEANRAWWARVVAEKARLRQSTQRTPVAGGGRPTPQKPRGDLMQTLREQGLVK